VGTPEDLSCGEDRRQPGVSRWLIPLSVTALLAVLGLVGLALGASAEFGSIPSALSYLRGARLIPLCYSMQAGTVARGEEPVLEFNLRNWSDKPLAILGARSTCTCLGLGEFPLRVPPHETRSLRVRLRTKRRKPGPISERVRIYTNEKRSDALTLAVTGVVQ